MKKIINHSVLTCALLSGSSFAADDVNISAILNFGYTDREAFEGINTYGVDEHAEGLKDGFWSDHSELAISSNIDDMFFGKMTLALAEHDGATELELEEAFIQTTSLPNYFSVRAGRFLSNVGYLNAKHSHGDSFADRPLVYRAFLNGHYYDDGLRVSWVAPTDTYLTLGSEIFKGGQQPAYSDKNIGSHTLFIKAGGDFDESNSWQLGASYLHTNNQASACSSHAHDEHEEAHDEEVEHEEHGHEEEHEAFGSCDFSGKKDYYMVDATWKWAPNGNFKYESFTLSAEAFFVNEKGTLAHDEHEEEHEEEGHDHEESMVESIIDADHTGYYISGVYQFKQHWALGLRYSEIDFDSPYEEDFKPTVTTAMVEYKHSHFSTVRLQYSQDKSTEDLTDDQITLQFTMALGAHGAHEY